jgi:hypothetical protein
MRGVETSRLVVLAKSKQARNARHLAETLRSLDVADLLDQYEEVRELAPKRGADNKEFFLVRQDTPIDREPSPSMREDLLEMAMVNDSASLDVGGVQVDVLMRQFPLFSSGSRKGLKGVDLVGHGGDRFWIIELKVPATKGYGQTPLRALLECLIYCAIAEANARDVRRELHTRYNREHVFSRPGLVIAAPTGYWQKWTPNPVTGDWWSEYTRLLEGLSAALDTPLMAIDLGDVSYIIDEDGYPRLDDQPTSIPVHYESV